MFNFLKRVAASIQNPAADRKILFLDDADDKLKIKDSNGDLETLTLGGGAANKVAFWSDANTLTSDVNLHYDDVNDRLGVGTDSPSLKAHLKSSSPVLLVERVTSDGLGPFTVARLLANYSGGDMVDNFGGTFVFQIQDDAGVANEIANFGAVRSGADNSGSIVIRTRSAGGSVTEKFRVDPTGNVGIGTATPAASAILDLTSTTKGFLPPRLTAAQASAIGSPAEGLLLYVTDTDGTFTAKGWWGYNGAAWEKLNN